MAGLDVVYDCYDIMSVELARELSMHTVTIMPPAPAQVFSPAEPSLWNTPGCTLHDRLSDLRAGSLGQVVPQQWLARTSAPDVDPPIAVPSTSQRMGLPRSERPCAARRHARVPSDTRPAPSAFRAFRRNA